MERNAVTVAQFLEKCRSAKVHASICEELQRIVNVVTQLIPDIESARPGWKSGIEELCSLNNSVGKGRLIIHHCSETSKLYSIDGLMELRCDNRDATYIANNFMFHERTKHVEVITRDATITRCERIKHAINSSLIHIQSLVPEPLAIQIANIVNSLMDVEFTIDVEEQEAGNALLSLIGLSDASEDRELKAFKIATSRLDLTSPKALLIERRCVKKLLEKFKDSDKKERILRYLIYLIKKYGKKLNEIDEDNEDHVNDVNKDWLSRPSAGEFNPTKKIDKPKQFKLLNEFSRSESESDLYPQDIPPEEYLCPLSSTLMYDPVIIASGQTYDRKSIEAWFKEGKDTCPKKQVKLPNGCMIPNSSLRKLISQWCQERGITIPRSCFQSIPDSANTSDMSHSRSLCSVNRVSAALLYGEDAKYLLQCDSDVSTVSSDTSFSSNISIIKSSDKVIKSNSLKFSWSDDYTKSQSFANFGYDQYLKFLSDISELPSTLYHKALEDIKHIFSSDDDSCHAMLYNGFTEAIMGFLKDACASSNARTQKAGLHILLLVLSNFSFKIPVISNDAARLMPLFLSSGLKLEVLTLIQMMCNDPDGKSIIVASGISLSIMDILQSGDPEFVGSVVKILSELSNVADTQSLILSSNCLSKLVPLLRDEEYMGSCLRILAGLCDTEEGAEAVAKADGCIPNLAEILDSDNPNEQADATAILLSLCSCSLKNCSLVMKEGVIPALCGISVNGNAQSKEDSQKLLHILRDLTRNDQKDSVAITAIVGKDSPTSSCNQPVIKKKASRRPGFVLMLFSKPKS